LSKLIKVIDGTDLEDGETIDNAELYYEILNKKSDKPIKRNRRKKAEIEMDRFEQE
jgi:hypothetical protein